MSFLETSESIKEYSCFGTIDLVHPRDPEFSVYGGGEAVRTWALRHRYLFASTAAPCAHGLHGMTRCPVDGGTGHCRTEDFDHISVWVPAYVEDDPPFVLMHPYHDLSETTKTYARIHGLDVEQHADDGWYGYGTRPIRLQQPRTPVHAWGLEEKAIVLLNENPRLREFA